MKRPIFTIVLCWSLCLIAGCERPASPAPTAAVSPLVGKKCLVQFRRDALGAASTTPISPNVGTFNGANTFVEGVIKSIDSEWVVVSWNGETWVPKSAVLYISTDGK